MSTMRAAVLTGTRTIATETVPLPAPGPGWVRLKVEACGVCGSDLRYFEGENPWSLHTLGYHKPLPPRMVLGHEMAGFVDAVGPDGDESLIGLRAAALCFQVCGKCPECLRGAEHLCAYTQHLGHGAGFEGWDLNPGGYAEACLVWERRVIPLPDLVSFEDAAFLDGLAVAVHAVRRSGLAEGGAALVLGAGPIGLLCAQVAAARGAGVVVCAETDPAAREHARRVTAAEALDPTEDPVAEHVRDVTGGEGVSAVIDTTGALEAQREGVSSLAPGGTMVYLAGPAAGLVLDLKALAGERSHTTSANFRYPEMDEALDLVIRGRIRFDGLVTHRFGLEDVPRAMQVMERKREEGAFKVVIEPQR